MKIMIDTLRGTLETESESLVLASPAAFLRLSEVWLRVGLELGHWTAFSWMGRQIVQLPDDVLRLAEVVWSVGPDVIVECGVYEGGLSLLLALQCRVRGRGRVIGVEITVRPGVREALEEAGVELVEGDSASQETARRVKTLIEPGSRVLVILDSDHTRRHVLAELGHYAPLVCEGSYVIVADTILAGDDTPSAAVAEFLRRNPEFEIAAPKPVFHAETWFGHLSYFEHGWLRRRHPKVAPH